MRNGTLAATLSIADDGAIAEAAETGEVITLTLANDTFVNPINAASFTLTNLPAGVTKGAVTRTGDTTVTIALLGNRTTDYDTDITNLTVQVAADQLTTSTLAVTDNSGVTLTANNDAESLSIADDGAITEGAESGEIITVTLSGGTFASSVTPANWTLTNLPGGVTKGAVTRTSDTTVTIALSGNRTTDYNADITNLDVSCTAAEVDDSSSSLNDNTGVTFTANVAPTLAGGTTTSATTFTLTATGALSGVAGDAAAFTINGSTLATAITNVAVAGTTITFTTNGNIANGETITLDYTPSGTTDLQTVGGDLVQAFAGTSITNNN
jgi:hypothetical protein